MQHNNTKTMIERGYRPNGVSKGISYFYKNRDKCRLTARIHNDNVSLEVDCNGYITIIPDLHILHNRFSEIETNICNLTQSIKKALM